MLTRKSIASYLDWSALLAAYDARSGFSVDDLMRREDEFGETFADIEAMASTFELRRYGDFLAIRRGSGRISRHSDKADAVRQISELNELRSKGTVGDVLDFVWTRGMLPKPRRAYRLEASDNEQDRLFLEAVRGVPFVEVTNFERYLNSETPFSTNHGVKGEEYDNVLVVLDDTLWTQYKFEAVLAGDTSKKQFERSLNLFYVSCSRAKKNLVVLATSRLSPQALSGAARIFGGANVREL